MDWYDFLFAGFLITFSTVSTDKSYILNNTEPGSWLSKENLTALIKVSLDVPQCANVFICDKTPGTERIFKEFISIYPYAYTLNNMMYGCDNYFLVATTDESVEDTILSIPTMRPETEILIVMDIDVFVTIHKRPIFRIFGYLRSNVNIAARNGLWTLSENYLKNRKFTEVSRYDEMIHKKGIVNLQGDLLQATTFYNPPLCFLKTTANRTVNGVKAEFFTAEDDSELDGVELKLFMLIADRLNFTYQIRKPFGYERIGARNGSNWEGGVIGQMARGETDFAFGGIKLMLDVYKFTNLTTPWKQLHHGFLVTRPKPHASFWALSTPLSLEVWAATIAMVIAQSICIYMRAWTNPHIPKRYRSFSASWTEMMGRLVGACAPREIDYLKFTFQLWHFIGVLMVTAYSSSLAAKLASRGFDKRIDSYQDFLKANLTWGREGPPPLAGTYFNLSDHETKEIFRRYRQEENESERHEKILKGKYAIFGNLVSSTFFPQESVRNDDLKNYRLMKQTMSSYYSSFAITQWLTESVDTVMLWMQETGLVHYHLNDVLYRRISSELREVLVEHDFNTGAARVLELTPLGAGFLFYIICLLISTIVFFLELRSVRGTRTMRQVLLDIKKKREIWNAEELKKKRLKTARNKTGQKYYLDNPRLNKWLEKARTTRTGSMKLMYLP